MLKKVSSEKIQISRMQQAYDTVYESETLGIQPLDINRWPRNRWDALIHSCPDKVGNLLEIGCGNGVVLHHVAERCDTLTGVEFSSKRCELSRANLKGIDTPIEIVHGNIEEGIDKPDGSYDVVLWADVIEHVIDVFAAMREVSRLLAPGGTLVTSTPNIAYVRYRVALLLGKFPGTAAKDEGFAVRPGEMYDGGHLHYFTVATLKRLYRMNGIEPTQVVGVGRLGKFHNLWPSLFSGTAQVMGIKK